MPTQHARTRHRNEERDAKQTKRDKESTIAIV